MSTTAMRFTRAFAIGLACGLLNPTFWRAALASLLILVVVWLTDDMHLGRRP